jgi:hypothetical protein
MTRPRSAEDRIASWLEEESTGFLPGRVLDATFERTRGLRQARRSAWRPISMTRPIPALIAAGAAAIIIVVGISYLRPAPGNRVGGSSVASPSATLIPSASPSPTQTPSSGIPTFTPRLGWTTYTSSQYGFSVSHPNDWNVDPADRAWNLDTDASDWLSPAMDDFTAPTGDVRVSVWSVPVDPDIFGFDRAAVEAWVAQYCSKTGSQSCDGILDQTIRLCLEVRDCHPGVLVASPDREVQAFFAGGIYSGQMVVVTVWRGETDPVLAPYGGGRRLIESFLAPMCVWPEDARPEPPPACLNVG